MAQDKMKVKCKLPKGVEKKKKNAGKGPAVTKRNNRPIQPKKEKAIELNNIKRNISKAVNMAAEAELRQRALPKKKLSNVQEAVAKLNKK